MALTEIERADRGAVMSATETDALVPAPLTDAQRRILDYYLAPRTGDELDAPAMRIQVTKRQLAFLLDAIEHYRATKCPLAAGRSVGCELLEWYEEPGTGAAAHKCFDTCVDWRNRLIEQLSRHAFGLHGTPPEHRPESVAAAEAAARAIVPPPAATPRARTEMPPVPAGALLRGEDEELIGRAVVVPD